MSYFKHEIKTTYEEEQSEWNIVDFYSKNYALRDSQVESSSPPLIFGDSTWVISLCRYCSHWNLFVTCNKDNIDDVDGEAVLALKKVDGSLDESLFQHDGEKYDGYYYIYRCENWKLMMRKRQFTTSNSLTIVCRMKKGNSYYPQATVHESSPLKLTGLDTLADDFKNLFASKGSCDVTLQVNDKAFKAHKAILVARSPVFAALFEHMKEKQTDILNIPDCDADSFPVFLEYVYYGKLTKEISFPSVLHLYTTSDKYGVHELKSFCIHYMERCLTEDNVCDVIILAEKNNEKKLVSLAQTFFSKNAPKIINTPKWKMLLQNNSDVVNKLIVEMGSKMNE